MSKMYADIRKSISGKIESGEWPVGFKIPNELDLCKDFDASRTTVRRAISELVEKGLIKRIKGTGSFVSRAQIFEKTTLYIESFGEGLKSKGLTCVSEILEQRMMYATDDGVVSSLKIAYNSPVLKLKRLRYSKELAEKGPIVLTSSYFPEYIGNIIQRQNFENVSLMKSLKMHGIHRARIEKTLTASHLPAKECRLLSANKNDLFFLVRSKSFDNNGRIIEYSESYYPIDRNIIKFDIVTE